MVIEKNGKSNHLLTRLFFSNTNFSNVNMVIEINFLFKITIKKWQPKRTLIPFQHQNKINLNKSRKMKEGENTESDQTVMRLGDRRCSLQFLMNILNTDDVIVIIGSSQQLNNFPFFFDFPLFQYIRRFGCCGLGWKDHLFINFN